MHNTYENLCHILEKEVCNIEQAKALSAESVQLLYYMTGSLENIKRLMNRDSGVEDQGMSGYMPYYDRNMSGVRRRDSMGRYMDYGHGYDYSRDDSRKKMVRKLETLMDDTMSENERQAIQDCINRIQ